MSPVALWPRALVGEKFASELDVVAGIRRGPQARSGTSGSGSVVSSIAPVCRRAPSKWSIVLVISRLVSPPSVQ